MCKEVEELNDVSNELSKQWKEFVAILLNDGGTSSTMKKKG